MWNDTHHVYNSYTSWQWHKHVLITIYRLCWTWLSNPHCSRRFVCQPRTGSWTGCYCMQKYLCVSKSSYPSVTRTTFSLQLTSATNHRHLLGLERDQTLLVTMILTCFEHVMRSMNCCAVHAFGCAVAYLFLILAYRFSTVVCTMMYLIKLIYLLCFQMCMVSWLKQLHGCYLQFINFFSIRPFWCHEI